MQFKRRSFGRGFGHGFGPRNDTIKPIKVGEEYDVEITEMGSRGDGITRIKNFVVFVNNTKVGEKARIKITDVKDKFGIGEKVSQEKTEVENMGKNYDDYPEEEEPESEEEETSEE